MLKLLNCTASSGEGEAREEEVDSEANESDCFERLTDEDAYELVTGGSECHSGRQPSRSARTPVRALGE